MPQTSSSSAWVCPSSSDAYGLGHSNPPREGAVPHQATMPTTCAARRNGAGTASRRDRRRSRLRWCDAIRTQPHQLRADRLRSQERHDGVVIPLDNGQASARPEGAQADARHPASTRWGIPRRWRHATTCRPMNCC